MGTILILIFFSVFCASVPMLFLLAVVWWLDRYEREPIWMVLLVLAWGMTWGVLLGGSAGFALTVPVQMVFGAQAGTIAGTVLIAPFVEEISKGLILTFIIWNRNFDNATDGFVYGAAAGLGFGMVENFMYFAMVSSEPGIWFGTVFLRTIFTAPMHMFASACFGATLGYAKWIRRAWAYIFLPPLGLASGMTIHFLWNLFAVASEQFRSGLPMLLSILIISGEFLLIFILFQVSLWGESRMIRRELEKEAAAGVIPREHVPHIASYFRRFGNAWLGPNVSKSHYLKTTTELAFRLAERDSCKPGRQRDFYEDQVQQLRGEIHEMLSRSRS